MASFKNKLILASKSPRRHDLLTQMAVEFKVVLKDVDESFPPELGPRDVALHIARKKAEAFDDVIAVNEVVLTADTIVCINGEILGKPENTEHAIEIIRKLSGNMHKVLTGVCLLSNTGITSFYDVSEVYFRELTNGQIKWYIEKYKPFDKAGAYGVQDWIGTVAIEKIVGSYTNIVGLPTQKLYPELQKLGVI